LEEEHPLLGELLVDPALSVIRPNALSVPSVAELVRQHLGGDADDPFVLTCHRTTGGNPLLLRELLRTLAAEDVVPSSASVATVERLAPDAVTRSVRVRLARLPDEAARLARAVAVLGDRAPRDHAAAVAKIERRDVAPAAAALARVDLLRPEPPFSFVHPLVRNAVYERIPLHDRALAHAEASELLRELHAPTEQVAAQLLLAPPEAVAGAVEVLRQAAERAAAEAGLESAVSYLSRALDEAMDDAQRSALLLELAAAEARLGAPEVIAHLRKAAVLAQNDEQRGEVALALGHALYWAGDEEEGVEALEQALDTLTEIPPQLRLRLEAELMVNSFRLPSGYEAARSRVRAIDVRPEDGPAARLILSMRAYAFGTGGGGTRREALELAQRALAAMPVDELAWNYTAGTYALLWGDELDAALRFLDVALADVRRRGAVPQFSSLSMTRALIQYTRGALLDAEADGRAALEAMPHEHVWFVPHAHGWLAQILVERGAVDEAAALVARVPEPADPFSSTPLRRASALIASARGDHRVALEQALRLGEALAAFGHVSAAASYPPWRSLAALAHHALGERQQALQLAGEEAELAEAWGAPRTLGRALRIRGLIEGGDDGIGLIRDAVAILAGSPARLEYAFALADLGAALRRANRRAEARDHLRQALELAQHLGATLLAEQAHEELIATGARPRRVELRGAAALTPSERRIAAMAAEGLSNRDIAQALFVTLRTVDMHLSNAFRKLNISSRTQLPGALAADATALVTSNA